MLESLVTKVKEHFPNRKTSCLKNVLLLSLCLLHKETVNLNKLKKCVSLFTKKSSKADSSYKRLLRIFDDYSRGKLWIQLLRYVFQILRLRTTHLIIDGTSWKRGKRWFHYMTLSVVYQGVSIPIYWKDISKHGHSNVYERICLIKQALKHYNLAGKILLADREYIGKDWFNDLIDNQIDFIIRIKKTDYKGLIDQFTGLSHKAMTKKVLKSTIHQKAISKLIEIQGMSLQFVAVKNPKNDKKDPVIYLLTNLVELPAKSVAQDYCIRTKIEQCFKHLKSNGFDLEQLNLRTKSRCRLLMAITVFTYVLSINEGLKTYKQVPCKTYADGSIEKAKSVFRHGFDRLANLCKCFKDFCNYICSQIDMAMSKYRSPLCILSSS